MRCTYAEHDGAYVLGALSAADRADYEQHLPDCAACSAGVRDLAGLPGLMGRVSLEMLEPPHAHQPPPDTLLPALVAEVRRSRRRTVRSVALAVAAAAVLIAGTVAAIVTTGDDDRPAAGPAASAPTTAASQQMESRTAGVTGWVSLTEVPWGTRIDLTCTYGSAGGYGGYGGGAETSYVMLVHTVDGRTERAGTWHAGPGRETQVSLATQSAIGDIASVEVTTADGTSVLRLAQ